jgi:phospholipase/lecithinase/hemolysin
MAHNEASKTKKYVVDALRKAFPDAFVWKINERMHSGVPDVLAVIDGHTFWFECKDLRIATREQLIAQVTEIQKRTIKTLLDAGATVWIVAFLPGGCLQVCDPESYAALYTDVVTLVCEALSTDAR